MSDKKSGNSAQPATEKDYFLDKGAAKIEEEERKTKKQKDYLADVQAAIPAILAAVPAKPSSAALNVALLDLLAWEKKARLASDAESTRLLAEAILDLCHDKGDWRALNDHITLLSKRRAQLLRVIKAVVDKGMAYLESAPDVATRRELIGTLRAVADGKIFLELERAELTMQLARMAEAEGRVAEAADVLQEVAVETIGSMEVKAKADYLLEQLRLCLDKKDYLRAELVAKKVKTKQFGEPGWAPVKIKYFELMVRFYEHSSDHLQVARAWKAIFDTLVRQVAEQDAKAKADAAAATSSAAPSSSLTDASTGAGVGAISAAAKSTAATPAASAMADTDAAAAAAAQEDEDDGGVSSADPLVARSYAALQNVIVYAALAPLDGDSRELLQRLQFEPKRLARVPAFAAVREALLGADLCQWPLRATAPDGSDLGVEAAWRAHPVFQASAQAAGAAMGDDAAAGAAAATGENKPADRWSELHTRIVQHNIRVISTAYARVPLARLAELLALDAAATERNLCDLVAAKQLAAKIDRPNGVVTFKLGQPAGAVLNQWGRDVEQLLDLLETTSHLIQKENMTQALKKGGKAVSTN
jgi:26S proteasome regulatory subunit N5